MIEMEKLREESPFARYFFGDDKPAKLFRQYLSGFNSLFALCSKMVKPYMGLPLPKCYKNKNRTMTVQSARIVHKFTKNVVP